MRTIVETRVVGRTRLGHRLEQLADERLALVPKDLHHFELGFGQLPDLFFAHGKIAYRPQAEFLIVRPEVPAYCQYKYKLYF